MNKIKKVSTKFEILEFLDQKVFSFKKEKHKITIYDKKLAEDLINTKFMDQYKKILYIIMDINSSEDATETDGELARNKIEELRSILINRYQKHIGKEILNKYIKMLLILEEKLVIPQRGKSR